ncbi:MAG: deoxyribodipyrimidine photo-lyase, partial [Pseudomonas sp.]
MRQLMWLRSDLRTQDNTALHAAMGAGPTIALYLISPQQWLEHDDAPCKVDFWLRNLVELRQRLAELNVPLLIRRAPHWRDAPQVIAEVCRQHAIECVQVNEEYGLHETRRDREVAASLEPLGVRLRSHLDQLFFPPGSVLTKSASYFQVYSQFRKVCYQRLHTALPALVGLPAP